MFTDEYFMKIAFQEAQKAFDENEIPVGALIVCKNKIIAKTHNQTERLNDVTAHAEMLAFTSASEFLGSKYLTNCTLYVTLEPCIMCAGAAFWTQIPRIVYGASDIKRGYTNYNKILLNKCDITTGILETKCSTLLKDFFRNKR